MATINPPSELQSRKKAWRNQRATVRYKCAPATAGKVYVGEVTEYHRAWIIDLSVGGVGLVMNAALDCGSFVVVRLQSTASHKVYEFSAQVMHTTMQSGGDWLVGCEFVTKLLAEELDDLL